MRQATLLKEEAKDAIPGLEEALPPCTLMEIEAASIRIPGRARLKRDQDFVASIKADGMLQEPTIILLADPVDGFVGEVIFGRRRILAAQEIGMLVTCKVYAARSITPERIALLALTENALRGEAWVKSCEDLRVLILHASRRSEQQLKTDLKKRGLNPRELSTYLAIAKLPEALFGYIQTGKIRSLTLAKMLIRLTPAHLEQLEQLALRGEDINKDTVQKALRTQMAPHLEALFADEPTTPEPQSTHPDIDIQAIQFALQPLLTYRDQGMQALAKALSQRLSKLH